MSQLWYPQHNEPRVVWYHPVYDVVPMFQPMQAHFGSGAASSQLQDGGNATTAQFGIAPRGNILSDPRGSSDDFFSLLPVGVHSPNPFTTPDQGEAYPLDVNFVAGNSALAPVGASFDKQCTQLEEVWIGVLIGRGALGNGVNDPDAPVFQITREAMAGSVGITQKKVTIRFNCAGRVKSLKQTTLWSATGKVRKRKDFVRSVCVMIRDYLVSERGESPELVDGITLVALKMRSKGTVEVRLSENTGIL